LIFINYPLRLSSRRDLSKEFNKTIVKLVFTVSSWTCRSQCHSRFVNSSVFS